jgi:hypothetical protein
MGNPLVGDNTWLAQSESGGAGTKFYRVRILPSNNPDNDVFDDWEEWLAGTNPLVADSPPQETGINQYGTWDSEREGEPRDPSTFADQTTGSTQRVRSRSAAGDGIVTAPNISPVLLIEQLYHAEVKQYFAEFSQSQPPLRRHYKKLTTVSSLQGGCPESPVGGTQVQTWTKENGLTTTGDPNRVYAGGAYNISSPTSRSYSGSVSSYDDPPNQNYDCPGTANIQETLSEEYTTDTLIQCTVDTMPEWTDEFYQAYYAYVYRDLTEDESYFSLSKLRYKFSFQGDNPENLPKTANWLVKFTPEDGTEPIWKAYTWTGTADETPVNEIDPQIENGGKDGYYEVYILPTYYYVDWSSAWPSPDGQIIDKGTAISFNADVSNGTPDLPPNQPVWYIRQLQANGSFSNWQAFTGGAKGLDVSYAPTTGGVYQAKAVFEMDNAQPELHYIRPENGDANDPTCKAGQIDCFGVVDSTIQASIANTARSNYGSVAYARSTQWLPSYEMGSNKCNLFVAHKATDAGAVVQWINRSVWPPFNTYPPSANQWAGTQSTTRVGSSTVIPNWSLLPASSPPQPGWIVAHPAGGGSGHVGIVHYDGKAVAAGRYTVNKAYNFLDGRSLFRNYTGP